jgi:hypothetical protein
MPTNVLGDQFVNQGQVPQYTEVTRSGALYNISTASAVAGLVAVPTSVAALEVYNNYTPASGNCLVIDQIWAVNVVGTAAPNAFGLYAMVTTQKAAPVNSALSVFSQSGRVSTATVAGGNVLTIAGSTVVANGWRAWGNPVSWGSSGAATPGGSTVADVNGRYIVPPGASFCLQVMSSVVGQTFTEGVSFVVAQIPNMVN